MMRLAKILAAESYVVHDGHGRKWSRLRYSARLVDW
jgi:hypothetical protein